MGLLNARLVPLEKLCQEPVLCCSCPLDSRRSSDEPFYGLQEAVRLGLGNEKSAPPDDDWWAHQILIRSPESAGLPSTRSIAGDSRGATVELY